jgi:hypothetical protein
MKKLTSIALMTACLLATGSIAGFADERYDSFMKKEVRQFDGDPAPKKCRRQVKKIDNATFSLCAFKGKPAEISVTVDRSVVTYFYKNGKLVRHTLVDGETRVGRGFKDDRLMAVWDEAFKTVKTAPFPEAENSSGTIVGSQETLAIFGFK